MSHCGPRFLSPLPSPALCHANWSPRLCTCSLQPETFSSSLFALLLPSLEAPAGELLWYQTSPRADILQNYGLFNSDAPIACKLQRAEALPASLLAGSPVMVQCPIQCRCSINTSVNKWAPSPRGNSSHLLSSLGFSALCPPFPEGLTCPSNHSCCCCCCRHWSISSKRNG